MMHSLYNIPESGIQIQYQNQGKPYLPDYPALHFSQSHSNTFGICATGPVPLGIDIEEFSKKRNWKEIAARFFHKQETEFIEYQKDKAMNAFYHLWTRKESWIKLKGKSIWQIQKAPVCLDSTINNSILSWEGKGEKPFSISLYLPEPVSCYSIVFVKELFPSDISLTPVVLSEGRMTFQPEKA